MKTDNELIHEFMGGDWRNEYYQWRPGSSIPMNIELLERYQESWDWLMPAWFKFQNVFNEIRLEKMLIDFIPYNHMFLLGLDKQDIKICHKALVEGIKWVNEARKETTV